MQNSGLKIVAEFIYRAGIMYTSEDDYPGKELRSNMFSLSGTEFFGAIGRSVDLGKNNELYVFDHLTIRNYE